MSSIRSLKPEKPVRHTLWLIPDTLPRGELVLLDGPAGVGKSCLAAAFAASLSRNPQLSQEQTILYLSSARQRDLIMTFLARQEPDYDRLRDVEYVPDPTVVQLKKAWQPHFTNFLQSAIKEHQPALVVIDSLEELFEESPFDDDWQWRDFWNCLHLIARAYDCTLLIPRRHGAHENRQYGPLTRTGSEITRFALTMHYHPNDPMKRVVTLAKNQAGPMGNQSMAEFFKDKLHLLRLEPHDYVRPSRSPATWLPNNTHQQETQEIMEVVEAFMNGKPATKKAVMQHVLDKGYSQRAYHRAIGKAKLQSGKLSDNQWLFLPTLPMYLRAMNARDAAERQHKEGEQTPETPANQPRAQGAAGDDPTPTITMPTNIHLAAETRLAG